MQNDELAGFTDEQIIALTRELESQVKSEKYTVTRLTKGNQNLDKRIEENQKKLKMST